MEVIPAIDLKGGKCVRLYQGDYSHETVFSEEPIDIARHWQSLGARRLHIVDLDGAAKGELCHISLIEEIARAVPIPIQLGGGLRRIEAIAQALELGVACAILGTAAIEDHALIQEACNMFGNRIIVSIDARDGYVATHGWQERTEVTAIELVQQMASLGVERLIYTDIARDGTLTEPNFDAVEELVAKTSLPIIAAGGIASLEHLKKLFRIGVEGAIVGRAIYTGDIDLKQALDNIMA
ncbi:MAG: 1-(5-phosphoribosyl)-5-[(5-phosphoribosylamino)methylideneamino]imidazole-4-carboxamide isomerase [Dehalococcoidia bacterium]|nr:MAG: 1-(5-phosphoribosyl)-5-[(5-phosphoribosylamino)methylideneamino]imidazole-4-carboxamide isomerase [Dehalococcoidia bacterium]